MTIINNNVINFNTTDWPNLTSLTDFKANLTPIYDTKPIRYAPYGLEYEPVSLGRFVKREDNGINLGIV